VIVVVERVARPRDAVDPEDVVHVAVPVVVQTVLRLARVAPHVGGQILVRVVHAGVDHAHHETGVAGGLVPGLGCVDVGVRATARLTGVVEAPELAEAGVVGKLRVDVDAIVRLGVLDPGLAPELREDLVDAPPLVSDLDGAEPRGPHPLQRPDSGAREGLR
jgi:hypothetical protein